MTTTIILIVVTVTILSATTELWLIGESVGSCITAQVSHRGACVQWWYVGELNPFTLWLIVANAGN